MANGYMGKVLWVDLSSKKLVEEAMDEKLCRRFIGGYGLGAAILFDRQKPGINPLGEENILGFTTGPFTGSPMLAGSRYAVVAKSPLTGGWGDANSGGSFGPYLKFAGYDAVFFKGVSEKPVYLFINNGIAELKEGSHLWGKDTYETEDILKAELGKDVEIACIGPSGENLSLISAVINNKGRAAGRSGLGAVMGSKKLKAIAVQGKMKVPLADGAAASELRRKYIKQLAGPVSFLGPYGTAFSTVRCAHSGDGPVKNWGGVGIIDFPNPNPLAIDILMKRQERKYGCYKCPVGCGGHMKAGDGEYPYAAGSHKPEYETLAMFGANCLNNNLESIMKTNDICNRYGIDTISAGAVIAFCIECYENGLITSKDTDGVEMNWGNHRSLVAMTEKLVRREGFGDILADGVKAAAHKIGKGAGTFAMHIQGQEVPAHDPKYGFQWGVSYRMDATPARHTQGPNPSPPDTMPPYDRKSMYGRGKAQKTGTSIYHVVNSSGMCTIVFSCLPSVNVVTEFMNIITGWDVTTEELLKAGERIANMRQLFNIREGLNALQFDIPGRITGKPPKAVGPTAGVTLDEETMLKEFLVEMDWDLKTAMPSRKKLVELGLGKIMI